MSPPPGSHSTTTGGPRALGHSAPKRMLAVVTASDPLSSANGITAILQLPGATRARLTWPPALAVLTAWTSAAGSWRETISPWVTWLVGVSTAVTTAETGASVGAGAEPAAAGALPEPPVMTIQTLAPGASDGGACPGLTSTATTAWPWAGTGLPRSAETGRAPAGRATATGRPTTEFCSSA